MSLNQNNWTYQKVYGTGKFIMILIILVIILKR